MKRIVLAIVLSGTLLASGAFAERPAASRPARPGPGMRPLEMLKDLNLTEQQQAQARTIMEQARPSIEAAGSPQARQQATQQALHQIVANVLTDAQRKQFEQMRQTKGGPGDMFRGLNLTPDQQAQVKTIMSNARTAAASATDPQAKRQIHQEALQKVRQTVLTPEQRQQFDETQAQRRGGPDSRRDGADKPRPGQRSRPGKHTPASRPA